MFGWMKRLDAWLDANNPFQCEELDYRLKKPPPVSPEPGEWVGRHLSENEIIDDLLAKIRSDEETVTLWKSDDSFHLPYQLTEPDGTEPSKGAGSLMFVGMPIRNWYGLWHPENPYTKIVDCRIEDEIITDPRHPDNFSGRIIGRVRKVLICGAERS